MESFFQRVKIYGEHCQNCVAFQNGRQTSNERKSAVHFQIWSFTYIAGYLSCRMTDIEGFLTIYGHSDNLLNNKNSLRGLFWSLGKNCAEMKSLSTLNCKQSSQNTKRE